MRGNFDLIQAIPPTTMERPVNTACQPQSGSIQLRQEVIARLRADEYDSTKALITHLSKMDFINAME